MSLWFPTLAQAQPEHEEGDGHDHSRPAKAPGEETQIDKFWAMSDKAFHDGDYPKAISFHKAIVILDPHDTESFGIAAWLMWSLGQKENALAHLQRGLKANPTDTEMWDLAGQQYDLQKKESPELAIKSKEAYINAVKFVPKDTPKAETQMLRHRLAHAAEKAGDLKLSLATWQKLVEDFPDDAVEKNNLARVQGLISKQRSASLPVAVGAGVVAIALIGGAFRGRKQRSPREPQVGQACDVETAVVA